MKPGPKAIIRELLAAVEEEADKRLRSTLGRGHQTVWENAVARLERAREDAQAYVERKPAKRNAVKRRAGELILRQGQTVNIVGEVTGKRIYSVTYHGEGMLEVFSPDTEVLISPRDPATVQIFKGGAGK